jgi:hypothetical protein
MRVINVMHVIFYPLYKSFPLYPFLFLFKEFLQADRVRARVRCEGDKKSRAPRASRAVSAERL